MGVDAQPEPPAVADPAGAARDVGAATARVGQCDADQVAYSVREGHRHLPDRDVGARVPAGWPELRRDGRQVPADRPATALFAQHVPPVFEPNAGAGAARVHRRAHARAVQPLGGLRPVPCPGRRHRRPACPGAVRRPAETMGTARRRRGSRAGATRVCLTVSVPVAFALYDVIPVQPAPASVTTASTITRARHRPAAPAAALAVNIFTRRRRQPTAAGSATSLFLSR
jgi:hypothetical protein